MFDVAKDLTEDALLDPKPGDRFSEMYAFWLYVVAVAGDSVATMEANAPCTFPSDATLKIQSKADLRKRLSYGTIPGYWVRLVDRGNDVSGWWADGL